MYRRPPFPRIKFFLRGEGLLYTVYPFVNINTYVSLRAKLVTELKGRWSVILPTNLNREEKCDVTLPWYQNFWITTTESLNNDDGDGNENGKKEAKR